MNARALNCISFLLKLQEGSRPENGTPPFLALCQVALSRFKNSCDHEHAIFLTANSTRWNSSILELFVTVIVGAPSEEVARS